MSPANAALLIAVDVPDTNHASGAHDAMAALPYREPLQGLPAHHAAAWCFVAGEVPELYADDVMVLAAAADAVGVFDTEVHDGPAGVRAHYRSNCFPVLLAICDI
jgi:hypothetical protein